jgi:hypothetical protein
MGIEKNSFSSVAYGGTQILLAPTGGRGIEKLLDKPVAKH